MIKTGKGNSASLNIYVGKEVIIFKKTNTEKEHVKKRKEIHLTSLHFLKSYNSVLISQSFKHEEINVLNCSHSKTLYQFAVVSTANHRKNSL